jgi:hypothetical protein
MDEQGHEYKHELVEAEHLFDNEEICSVQFADEIKPAFTSMGKYPIREQKLPKLSIACEVNPSQYKDCVNVSFYNYHSMDYVRTYTVPRNMKLRKLTGEQNKKMVEKYREYKWRTFEHKTNQQILDYAGMIIGSDFEMFIEDKNDNVIPAHTFLGDKTKTKPNKYGYGRTEQVCHDDSGFCSALSTTPDGCLAYHVDSSYYALTSLLANVRKKNPGAKLSTRSVIELPYEMLKNVKDEHKVSNAYPVINIYGFESDRMDPLQSPYRFANGDIHFGIGAQESPRQIENMIKALDAILGVCCVSLFRNLDTPIRRQYVGLPGDYRLPKHGLEYKVLSNAWVLHPFLQHIVFDFARKSLTLGRRGFLDYWKGNEKETQEVIMNCDYVKAQAIMEQNKDTLLRMFMSIYNVDNFAKIAYDTYYNGADSVIKDITDIEGAWCLNYSRGEWLGHSEQKWCNGSHGFRQIIDGKKL